MELIYACVSKAVQMWRILAFAALVFVVGSACGAVHSKDSAISDAKFSVEAVQVSRADAKEMTWSQWQERSGDRGGPIPPPVGKTQVWVVALKGRFLKLHGYTGTAVVVLYASNGNMVLAETGSWDWPPYWDSL